MSRFTEDDVRRFLGEALTYEDIKPNRYDELMQRACAREFTDAIERALDHVFGTGTSHGHTDRSELVEIAYRLAEMLVKDDGYVQVRGRIKKREDL